MKALIFDCDGVLVDTERDGHRTAFNEAFKKKGLDVYWSVDEYGDLLKTAGGKERMRDYFERHGWPQSAGNQDAFIKELHTLKTELFMQIIEEGRLPLRPGVGRLMDAAIGKNIELAVCSTSNERAVNRIVDVMVGEDRKKHFRGIFAGDIVSKKKPHPEIYLLALKHLRKKPEECVVIEDSRNGLLAAKAAGMKCVITVSSYTGEEDFSEADRVVPEIGDPPNVHITIELLEQL